MTRKEANERFDLLSSRDQKTIIGYNCHLDIRLIEREKKQLMLKFKRERKQLNERVRQLESRLRELG